MTFRSFRIASTLLCALPLIWTACDSSDTPESSAPYTSKSSQAPGTEAPTPKPIPTAAATPQLADTEWKLIALGGDAISATPDTVPTVQFTSAQGATGQLPMIGFSGCNNFFGNYTSDGDSSLSIPEPLGMTKRACDEPIQTLETALMKSLAGASSYSLDGRELTIESQNGTLRFSGG